MSIITPFKFKEAFYIKLGRGGEWETDSIETGKLRFGWPHQSLDDINTGRWDLIEDQIRREHVQAKSVATQAFHGLKIITQSAPDDVWITFYKAKLWWTRLASCPVREDSISKFRQTVLPWSDCSVKNRRLMINDLPGKLAMLQGYRWTVCRVGCADLLERTLGGTKSDLATAISGDRANLAQHLTESIKELHWKDFETLVDLVFRHTGWIRVSVLGQQAKAYDLELREPITGDRYVVQVKSKAGLADVKATVANFSFDDFRRVFFVVHSPEKDITQATDIPDHVVIVPPDVLALQAIDAGLVKWLEDKVS